MSDKKATIISIIGLTLLTAIAACLAVFVYQWKTTLYYYDNVDYEWNDETDSYDIYIEYNQHYSISTSKTTYIFAPEDTTLNMAIIEKRETILNQLTRYSLVKFYLNVGWRGEENERLLLG